MLAMSATAQTPSMATTDSPAKLVPSSAALVTVLYLRADWCSVCTIVDPRIDEVRTRFAHDPRVAFVEVDFSAADADYDAMINAVVDADLVDIYNGYFMMTGFGVVSPAAASSRAACLTRVHTAEAMELVIEGVLAAVNERGAADVARNDDLLCPQPRANG